MCVLESTCTDVHWGKECFQKAKSKHVTSFLLLRCGSWTISSLLNKFFRTVMMNFLFLSLNKTSGFDGTDSASAKDFNPKNPWLSLWVQISNRCTQTHVSMLLTVQMNDGCRLIYTQTNSNFQCEKNEFLVASWWRHRFKLSACMYCLV